MAEYMERIITSGGWSYIPIKIVTGDEESETLASLANPIPVGQVDFPGFRARQGTNTIVVSGTVETTLVPSTPLEYHDISYLSIANTTNAQRFQIEVRDDVGGTVRAVYHLSDNDHVDIPFDTNFLQTTIGGAWTLKCSSASAEIVANVHFTKRAI